MTPLAAAFTPREVEYPVYRGLHLALSWRSTVVAPPTTADALAVLDLAAAPGADGHRAGLLAVARRWLRPRAAADLSALTDRGLARALAQMVERASGVTTEEAERALAAAAAEGAGAPPAPRGDAQVLRLALALGVPLGDVLALPWPAFLAALRALPRALDEAEYRRARAALAAQSDRRGWEAYARAMAGPADEAAAAEGPLPVPSGPVRYDENPAVWERKGMTREEHEAERRAALDAWAAARRARTEAEA